MEREKAEGGGGEEEGGGGGDDDDEDATGDIGKIHNAKYITGLTKTLESALDKWIVSGAMATVS
jgi:hypothetical protein